MTCGSGWGESGLDGKEGHLPGEATSQPGSERREGAGDETVGGKPAPGTGHRQREALRREAA